jgi:hypothetical protein
MTVPRMGAKLDVFAFKLRFTTQITDLKQNVDQVCSHIVRSANASPII